jgi:hypothetical protein
MRSRDLINGFDYNEHMQRQMFCFGSSDDDGGAGGGGLSDEDIDQDVQQDIAAASAGLSRDDYSYGGGFDPGGRDEQIAAQAVRDIVEASTVGTGAAQRSANAQAMQNELAQQASVRQAVNNLIGYTAPSQTTSGGITAEQVAAMNAAQKNLGISPYKAPQNVGYDPVTGMPRGLETVVAPDGQLVTKNLAGLTEDQRQGLPLSMKIAGMMGSNPYAYEIEPVSQRVIGQIGTPGMGLLGQGIDALTNLVLGPPKTFEDLLARGAYTGINAPDMSGGRDGGSEPPVKPVNPATGQCDEGYMFDEDMQACRLDTRSSMGDQPSLPQVPFQPGGYARMGLLDEAPTNLPQFQQRYGAGFGTPSDFAAANTAFRQQSAYRPEYFKRPYPTDGYTLLS